MLKILAKDNPFSHEAARFVSLAEPKEDQRPALNSVRLEESRILAMDGHRLHMAKLPEDFPANGDKRPAHYTTEKKNKTLVLMAPTTIEHYPDYGRIIPKEATRKKATYTYLGGGGDSFSISAAVARVRDAQRAAYGETPTTTFHIDYLKDILPHCGWCWLPENPEHVAVFVNDENWRESTLFAFLMPMRMHW